MFCEECNAILEPVVVFLSFCKDELSCEEYGVCQNDLHCVGSAKDIVWVLTHKT
jgi:hypothetical protein